MKYKINEDVFFKKLSEEMVSIIKYNDDDYIYKLEKIVARVFLLLIEDGFDENQVKKKFSELGIKLDEKIVDKIINDLIDLKVIQSQ